MSENRESGPSVTGALPNTNSFVQRANDVLSQNITDAEKEQLIRQLLGSQVTGDDCNVQHKPREHMRENPRHHGNRRNALGEHIHEKPRHRNNPRNGCVRPNEYRQHHDNNHIIVQKQNIVSDIMSDIIEPFMQIRRPYFECPFGRERRFIGPFDLMEPDFFGSSRLQYDVGRMFDDQYLNELEQECKLDDTEEKSKHLKFTSKLVSIGQDGVRRSRVVNGVTKIGKDGKQMTHKKMISSDDTGKTITEVFADGTERITKQPFVKCKENDRDSD